jgi:hypothetical protein
MNCQVCNRVTEREGACRSCFMKVKSSLVELPDLHFESQMFITPGRSGSGKVSAERSIGVNVAALDFSLATDLLRTFHSWEVIIRTDRKLTPPALVPKEPTIEAEVQATVDFHCSHLEWSLTQEWAVEFASEVYGLHAKGRSAAKRFTEQARRIPCPTDDCKRFVVIDVENLMDDVSCFGCKQSWSVLRLIALAMSNPNKKFYLDVEAIAAWMGTTERTVYNLIKTHKVERRGSLYDLSAIIKARSNQL